MNAVALPKNINFKTVELKDTFNDNKRVCGDVRHCTVEIPFHLFVEVEGARPGDHCQIERAFVEGQLQELLDVDHDKCVRKLLEKDIVRVEVKVTRTEQIDVPVAKKDC